MPLPGNTERRASPRLATRIDGALVSSRGREQDVEIVDLSVGGFAMTLCPHTIMDSSAYAITIAGLEPLGARLRWAGRTEAGFAFERPLHPAVRDHIVRANPPRSAEPSPVVAMAAG